MLWPSWQVCNIDELKYLVNTACMEQTLTKHTAIHVAGCKSEEGLFSLMGVSTTQAVSSVLDNILKTGSRDGFLTPCS